ncbi:Deoxyribodipyrimidine photo-lyase [Anaerohalosphaera lusitana]|uniref:Deoxyribodipyrimidine photo-lyase n=1 Tax=Anaerohalosphaera lusitana TaxID=1936003 RepID=A0A1U9NPH0_9BACT|nr:deoxyribodipyrimidine photo-lyase [Anaerohalosphaera lusitana]AQT69406.1 Deoxyribodipyrimidine photo-lyase [Anaerohalosphaera lusitana]
MIQDERIEILNDSPVHDGEYVLYWMQAAQRAQCNHALEYAIDQANELSLGVVVYFGLTDDYPEANERHYWFMLEGLSETITEVQKRGIAIVVHNGDIVKGLIEHSQKAAMVIVDAGHLHIQRKWREQAGEKLDRRFVEIETNLIVPIETASQKENFSAGTLRPRINKHLDRFMVDLKERKPKVKTTKMNLKGFDVQNASKAIKKLKLDRSVSKSRFYQGGTTQANKFLDEFIDHKIKDYADGRNDPCKDVLSNVSPYLHFGQISPLHIALRVKSYTGKKEGKEAYLEELIVRRELAHNFVAYNDDYDKYEGLPPWAKATLEHHSKDKREHLYSLEELEQAQTHDPYWNAAQHEMVITGKMHGYMRMYWGKKILEWTKNPAQGFELALYLNNKYELDGRDANSYTGIAWCFGKHDRAWAERGVFGKVRYMNANGLKRKFDPDAYVEKVSRLNE